MRATCWDAPEECTGCAYCQSDHLTPQEAHAIDLTEGLAMKPAPRHDTTELYEDRRREDRYERRYGHH